MMYYKPEMQGWNQNMNDGRRMMEPNREFMGMENRIPEMHNPEQLHMNRYPDELKETMPWM